VAGRLQLFNITHGLESVDFHSWFQRAHAARGNRAADFSTGDSASRRERGIRMDLRVAGWLVGVEFGATENASTENESTGGWNMQASTEYVSTNMQGWKT